MKKKVMANRNIIILLTILCIVLYAAVSYFVGARQDETYRSDYSNYNAAEELIGQGKYDEAEKLLQDLKNKYPDSYLVLWNYGSLRLSQGKYNEARQYYDKAIKQRPFILDNANFLYCYGKAAFLLGDYGEARSYLERAVKSSTDSGLSDKIKSALKDIDSVDRGVSK